MNGQIDRLRQLQKLKRNDYSESVPGVISFASGKGGTGKTVISLNAAYTLSLSGKKVLYIDSDFNFPNAHILLNKVVKKTIADFFLCKTPLNESIIKITPGFHFIAGYSAGEINLTPDCGMINQLFNSLKNLSSKYDVIIFDLPSGASGAALEILKKSAKIIIVTTPEPTAVMDAYVLLKILSAGGKQTSVKVIINKCSSKKEATDTAEKLITAVNHFLKFTPYIMGYLLFDPLIYNSVTDQKLLISINTTSPSALQLKSIAFKLIENNQLANILQTEYSRHSP